VTGRRRRSIRVAALCGVLAALVAVAIVWQTASSDRRLRVVADGRSVAIAPGMTLGQLARRLHIRPRTGRLLSISGATLDPAVSPGRLLLNGRSSSSASVLREGDAITARDGRDLVEPTRLMRRRVRGGRPADPEFTLARTPGYELLRKGTVSGEIALVRFVQTGRPRTPHAVALTFDDGPWPAQTSDVLALLRRLRVKATFFVIGRQAAAYPALVRAELRAGMTVGNHSWDHPLRPSFRDLAGARIEREIVATNGVIQREGGHPVVFRPPGGSTSPRVERLARRHGSRVVLWSVDPRDWTPGITRRQIVRRVLRKTRPGSIILLHDGGGDRRATLRAVPRIVRAIRRRGLRFVRL
jgi:peptidoglycan-N-acetylglucosamine deacetylase